MNQKPARPSISESHPAPCPMCGVHMYKNPTNGDFNHPHYGNGCLLDPVGGGLLDIARWNVFTERMKQ